MNSTIPADLHELKTRFETWRTNRKYLREPIPNELWNAAADLSRHYPPSLVGRGLKLDSSRSKNFCLSDRRALQLRRWLVFLRVRFGWKGSHNVAVHLSCKGRNDM